VLPWQHPCPHHWSCPNPLKVTPIFWLGPGLGPLPAEKPGDHVP
jgi:hypothetical protein